MTFSEEQIRQFQEQGYVALPQFWNPEEVAAMQAEIERFKRVGLLHNVATMGDGVTPSQTTANLQLCPMSPHSALFRAVPFVPQVVDAVRELIGDPVVLHLDQVFLKPARHGSGTNWHQDNAYFHLEDPLKGTAMWTAVHDATVANGTLRVIPGCHHDHLEHSRDPQRNHHLRCYPEEAGAVPIELPAGGVVFFAYGVPHATGANRTDRDRAGAAYHFLNRAAVAPEYFHQAAGEHHPVLSGPDADDGTREYGHSLADIWDVEVARATA